MSVYKNVSLIPEQPAPPAEPPAPGPDHTAPTAPAAGAVTADHATTPTPDSTAAATGTATAKDTTPPAALWQNSAWAVTGAGIESRVTMANGLRLPCDIDAARLLRTRAGMDGVSDWALHVASKSWCGNPDEFIEALAQALHIHHPGQTAIDMTATAEAARRIWARSRSAPEIHVAGPNWTDDYPAEHRDLLIREGMPPGTDRRGRAHEFNESVIRLAGDGLDEAHFRAAIEHLKDEMFGDGPPTAAEIDIEMGLDFLLTDEIRERPRPEGTPPPPRPDAMERVRKNKKRAGSGEAQ
jgi:hypothetical protein